ncbi:hypothetical protein QAD02_017489 [Eretmocerus hayati]|uniref:Uncharacterized protein n=1 Tax=Eretmocerus hayati TaxID=131215 RepID=A0ACC2PEF6_9HYME|nr:hypothetical protein QAD02_017489 [Eretmocerus hayati]
MDSFEAMVFLSILGSLFATLYLYFHQKHTYWARRGVYSPPTHWFFGHFKDAIFLRISPSMLMGKLYEKGKGYPVMGIYVMHKPFLLLRSPDVIKQILVKDFNLFSDRYFASKREDDIIGSKNLFAVDNPEWKYLRVKLSPAFSSGKNKRLFDFMLDSSRNMSNRLEEIVAEKEATVNVREVSSRYTTDIISSLSFGIRTNSFQKPDPEFFKQSRGPFDQGIYQTMVIFFNFFFPRMNDLLGGTMLGSDDKFFRNVFWESMEAREKSGAKRGDIIDLLVDLKNEKKSDEFQFEGDHLLAQSFIMLTAGLETSATTMSFTLHELSMNPELQAKAREEIRDKIGSRDQLTYERASEMTYLHQVISETLRLYPPAPIIDRVALFDYKIPDTGTVIEKGTVVYTSLNGIHRDPEFHPEPLKYDPDRFSEKRKQEMKPGTYMPFGDGPRICIGMRIGTLQTVVGLITILSEYEVLPDPNYENGVSKRAIFTAPAGGLHLRLKRNPVF